jgi:ketosteroid isomerase-like protein
MEAPPGFEPGMEVLQTYPVAKRCLPDIVEIRICLNNSMSFAVTTLSPNHEVLARRRDSSEAAGCRTRCSLRLRLAVANPAGAAIASLGRASANPYFVSRRLVHGLELGLKRRSIVGSRSIMNIRIGPHDRRPTKGGPMRLLSAAATCVFVLALGGGGCSQAGPPEFGKADVDNINKMLQEYAAAYNAKDALKVSQMFTGAAVVMPPNSSTVRGQENVRDYYVKRFNQGASGLSLEAADVGGHGSLAFISGNYRLNLAPPGGEVRRDRGKFLFILRHVRDRWMLEHLMFSSDFEAPHPT